MTRGRLLVLWDVDHTLIENGGVSKQNYRLAFELLTGRPAIASPKTDGRTDIAIMEALLEANGEEVGAHSASELVRALTEAGERNASDLKIRGHALPGAQECLAWLAKEPDVIQSVLTGNIEANARVKLAAFGLDSWLNFAVGAFGAQERLRSRLVGVAQGKAELALGFDASRDVTLLIGDTGRDVEAGLVGGARVLGVATGSATVEELVRVGADQVVPSLAKLGEFAAAVMAAWALGPTAARFQSAG